MRILKLVFLVLFSKKFRISLQSTIEYAIRAHDKVRGTGASDVMLFDRFHLESIYSPLAVAMLRAQANCFEISKRG